MIEDYYKKKFNTDRKKTNFSIIIIK